MPEWLRWALAALATYRLVQMLGLDDGPWDVFHRLREAVGGYRLGPQLIPTSWLGYLVRCPYCMGLYLAPLCAAACIWPTLPGDLLLGSLALAGAQALLQGKRTGWLGDTKTTATKPKMRVRADGTIEEAQ
jgi:hypothetical protein